VKKLSIAIFTFVFLFLSIPAFAESAKDIKGWNKAEWGMKESELIGVFKDTIVKSDKRQYLDDNKIYSDLEISEVVIDGIKFNVSFEMGSDDNKLKRVRLRSRVVIPDYFSNFEQLLTMKYGSPIQKDRSAGWERGDYNKSAAWSLPSTKIELIYAHSRSMGDVLNIVYIDQGHTMKDINKL